MHKRLWLSVAMLAVGASLLVAAGFASPAGSAPSSPSATAKKGGTLHLNLSETDIDYADPALAYFQPSWLMLYVVCRNLLNYPDKPSPAGSRLVPDAAVGLPRVSGRGRVYTFTLRRGLRFSNGKALTAANYAAAIDRLANPKTESPSVPFFSDIVGATKVNNGSGKHVAGVIARGRRLTIRLVKPGPDIMSRLAMPFFCAVPKGLPASAQGVNTFPSAGPYFISSRTPGKPIVLSRNKFYKGPRPHNASKIIVTPNTDLDQSFLQVSRGDVNYDIGGIPASQHAKLAKRFGINKGRYFVNPTISTRYISLNNLNGPFKGVAARRAVNFAVDRPGIIKQRGAFAGSTTDQLLPPRMRGYLRASIYPTGRPNKKKATSLAPRKSITLFTSNSPVGIATAQVMQNSITSNTSNKLKVDIKSMKTSVMYKRCGTRSEAAQGAFDMCSVGWIADYPDPFDFVNVLLSGDNIHDSNNNNYSYFNSAKYNRQMRAAALLFGAKRYRRYGALDVSIMKNAAPIAAWDNDNERDFISKNTGCFTYHPVYGGADLALLCRK